MKKKSMITTILAGCTLLFAQAGFATDGGRTDLAGPGEAEVVAGIGYEHTLFDSADNKCQHCHNDLYDTWKTSMHAKSWADPIFQSKYQDFLRLQVSKIGSIHPISGVEYVPGMVPKAAQVCVKCHAPGAYYSRDYKVTLAVFGDMDDDPNAYDDAQDEQTNLATPTTTYDPSAVATVSSMATDGTVYLVSYHVGHQHNREGINCGYCHSIETVRMMKEDFGDGGEYTLANPIKMGPNGQIVREAGETLFYDPAASDPDMNAFFALVGPEIYGNPLAEFNYANTPKDMVDFDTDKTADGRHTIKSTFTGCDENDSTLCYFTGGPFYGPFGVTAVENNRDDDITDRHALVNPHFTDAVEAADGDKFTSEHHFAAYGKSLCLSCHQRSSLALNPEFNGIPGIQDDDQFLELCSTWTAMSDGVGDNYSDTETAPKCQRCHMEPLANKIVLHKWDEPDELFTAEDGVTEHFDPDSGIGPVAEGYLNNHAFMGANTKDFGLVKIQSGFEARMSAKMKRRGRDDDADDSDDDRRSGKSEGKGKAKNSGQIIVRTSLQNKTAHMFPGAHPMRRVLTRVVVSDADGNKLPFLSATGRSKFRTIRNQLAVLEGDEIMPGYQTVKVKYDDDREIVTQGQTPNLDDDGETVSSQMMDPALMAWSSPDGTVINSEPVQNEDGSWSILGETTVKKIIDTEATDHFTRIYGRETGKRKDGVHVIRPGFDSNIAADNRLEPNEQEIYQVAYSTKGVTAWPVTVTYKVYYLKKGGNGQFPTGEDGFLKEDISPKAAIFEVYSESVVVE